MTVQTVDLSTLLQAAGGQCDVLKLDIEGAEYEVLAALCSTGEIRRAGQVLVEFHHGVTHHPVEDTERAVLALQSAGYALAHVEGRNYIFRRSEQNA